MAAVLFIDTHVHFYDLQHPGLEYGWLQPGVKHHILEAVEPIQAQRYWADDWIAESRFANVVKSIHVECAVGTPDPVEETRWLQAFADPRWNGGIHPCRLGTSGSHPRHDRAAEAARPPALRRRQDDAATPTGLDHGLGRLATQEEGRLEVDVVLEVPVVLDHLDLAAWLARSRRSTPGAACSKSSARSRRAPAGRTRDGHGRISCVGEHAAGTGHAAHRAYRDDRGLGIVLDTDHVDRWTVGRRATAL